MTSRKIFIEAAPADNFVIHLSFELNVPRHLNFNRPLREDGRWEEIGKLEQSIVEKLLSIDGLESVGLEPYRIYFRKARLFDITDVIAAIAEAFKEVFGEHVEVVSLLTGD